MGGNGWMDVGIWKKCFIILGKAVTVVWIIKRVGGRMNRNGNNKNDKERLR